MEEPLAGPGALSMQRVSLFADRGLRRVLALGAHCDDIEIGCGGTLLRLAAERPDLEVRWVVFCSTPERAVEARASAAAFLEGVHTSTVAVHTFRDGYLPHAGAALKDEFEAQKRAWSPELILTHYRNDLHQDHRLLEHFPTQAGKPWFTADLFRGLARIRGMECVAPDGFAEAFYCRKAVF